MKSVMKSNGFSLIETLIALVILAIALLALAGLMVTTTRNNSFGSHVTEASTFAQGALETLRVARWTDIVNGNDTVTGGNGIRYNRVWTVTLQPAPPNDLLRVVNIAVNWTDTKNHSITVGPYNIMKPPGQ
jgi:prepilin-type N-terminal cleavage/methylation domain-containing protein